MEHRAEDRQVGEPAGAVGDYDDNAMCESCFTTLRCELLDRSSFKTPTEARIAVFDFMEGLTTPIVGTPTPTIPRPSITNLATLSKPASGATADSRSPNPPCGRLGRAL
jgi:hypothetical protein